MNRYQQELRATGNSDAVKNSIWDGLSDGVLDINIFGAKNEVVSFNLILEAAQQTATNISISLDKLVGPNGFTLNNPDVTGNGVFNWNDREIELFYVDYLEIEGLSAFGYADYDERLVPEKLRRPFTLDSYNRAFANPNTTWLDRPNHNQAYPDIAVPLELVPNFEITAGQNQSIWGDIYIPKDAPSGFYNGTIQVQQGGLTVYELPLSLEVKNFTLPDESTAQAMVYLETSDINQRYTGDRSAPFTPEISEILDHHFQLAHRHRIPLINTGEDRDGLYTWALGKPPDEWLPRLDGSLFTPEEGYEGPGVGTGTGVYSIGTYRNPFLNGTHSMASVQAKSNEWVQWFQANAPNTDYFVYLIDESSNYAQIEQWASWIANNPGIGRQLQTFATIPLPEACHCTPSLSIPASTLGVGDISRWQTAFDFFNNQPDHQVFMYNGSRPASGSFMTEDEGVALRELAWGQYKMGIDRWFYWAGNAYRNESGELTNVFEQAQTFGYYNPDDPRTASRGKTGYLYSNGDGVLFYPGTDVIHPNSS